MTGKRTWVLFGLVGAVAGLAWAVKSGRLGGGGSSPVPIMMTPAVTAPDGATSGVPARKPAAMPASVPAAAPPTASKPPGQAKPTAPPAGPAPARLPATARAEPSSPPPAVVPAGRTDVDAARLARVEAPRVLPRADAPARRSSDQVLELVRAGRLAEAREALKASASDEGSAQLVRVVMDLERDLLEVGSLHRSGDWFQLEQALERWDRPGRVVPRPDPPVVAEARAWSEAQRRSRVSQKEWRLALEEALRWENRARIQSLLDVRDYPDDPIRAKARDRLAMLERSEQRLAEIRGHVQAGRFVEAERLLSSADPQGRLEVRELREQLARRKADHDLLTQKWVAEVEANGRRMSRVDFEDSLARIPAAQQAEASVKQVIARARQQVEAREAAASAAAARVAAAAPEATPVARPVVPPPASPTVLPPAARAPEPARVATNAAPASDPDEDQFRRYQRSFGGRAAGSLTASDKAKVREFLERYSKRHPEKEKEIRALQENLRNFF